MLKTADYPQREEGYERPNYSLNFCCCSFKKTET